MVTRKLYRDKKTTTRVSNVIGHCGVQIFIYKLTTWTIEVENTEEREREQKKR